VRSEEVVDVGAVVVIPAPPLLLRDIGPPLPWRGRAVPGACRALLLPGAGRPAPGGRPVLAVRVAAAPLLERETHEELLEQWRNNEEDKKRKHKEDRESSMQQAVGWVVGDVWIRWVYIEIDGSSLDGVCGRVRSRER
jgi:hypothetical protein